MALMVSVSVSSLELCFFTCSKNRTSAKITIMIPVVYMARDFDAVNIHKMARVMDLPASKSCTYVLRHINNNFVS
jgi:hypothetical protein